MGASTKQPRVTHNYLKKMGQKGPGQVLTSSGSRVSLEDESSWMCLAMPFSSCRGAMHGGIGICPLHQLLHAQVHLVSVPGALWAPGPLR